MTPQHLSLTTNTYSYGTCHRAGFRGYPHYHRYSLAGLTLVRTADAFLVEDELFQSLIAAGAASNEGFAAYASALGDHFSSDDNWDVSSEEMHLRADLIRRGFISREVYLRRRGKQLQDSAGLLQPRITGIDQRDEFDCLKEEKSSVLVVPGDPETFPPALKEAMAFLLTGKKVFLLLKSDPLSPLASVRDFELLLTLDGFKPLKHRLESGALSIIKDEAPSRGIDYSTLPCDQLLQDLIDREDIFLRGFSEDVLLSVKDLKIPAIVGAYNQSLHAKAILGEFSENRYSLVYIPATFSIFPHAGIVERPTMTYAQLAAPEGKIPPADGLKSLVKSSSALSHRRAWHDYDTNGIVGDDAADVAQNTRLCGATLFTKEGKEPPLTPALFSKEGADRSRRVFCPTPDNKGAPGNFLDRAIIDIITVNTPASADVICIEDYQGRSLRQYLHDNHLDIPRRVLSNLLFFVTPVLVLQYNNYRADRPREQISPGNIHLDYRLQNGGDERIETFPLFGKACISHDSSGNFHFFSRKLEAGSIEMGGLVLSWGKADVNTQSPGGIALFTPAFAGLNESIPVKEYRKEVGHGRFNMIFIGQSLTCARLGEVILPSVGTVLSLEAGNGQRLATALKMAPAENGYYGLPAKGGAFSLNLAPPEGFTPAQWGSMRWAYGGGLSLIQDGLCVCDDDTIFGQSLGREGWLSALSIQAQESGVHAPMRHPRTAIGQTEDGKLVIMVISGRLKSSQGAAPKEIADLGRKYIPNLKNLVNVDGGASSFLAATGGVNSFGGGAFTVLSETCASNETTAGEARAVTTMLAVEF